MAWRALTGLQAHAGLRGGSGVAVTVSVRQERAARGVTVLPVTPQKRRRFGKTLVAERVLKLEKLV
jgi:hypothetical protein